MLCANSQQGAGLALLVSFDGFFDVLDCLDFEQEVTCCKRLGDSDLFLVAEQASLHLLRLVGGALQPVHSFAGLAKDRIETLAYSGHDLFLLHGGGTDITHVLFDDLNLDAPE